MMFGWDLGECSLKITNPIIFGICEDQKSSTVCQMVGGGSKQGANAGSKAVQWNPHLHCMEPVEGEE